MTWGTCWRQSGRVPIRVATFGVYFTGPREEWAGVSQSTFAVNAFTKALKGKEIRNYNDVPVPSGVRRLDSSTAMQSYDWFAEMAAPRLSHVTVPFLLVPIPGSSCDSQGAVRLCPTMRMALALAQRLPLATAHPALWFDRKMQSASKGGGPRHPALIFPRLLYDPATPMPGGGVVLIDDVCTSGGHIQACSAKLRQHGHGCSGAVCAVQSEENAVEVAWRYEVRDVDDWQP